ncbi:MAG: PAS domain-containing protein [Woeseia sp.]|nr:PAS domain-containing protein [Woeseia sp.]
MILRDKALLKADRIGLVILVASLSAIAAIAFVIFQYQQDERVSAIRSEGLSLARAVASVPYEQLVPGGKQQGVLQVLRHSASNDHFAYASVINEDGLSVAEVVADGVIAPIPQMPREPSGWIGELAQRLPTNHQPIMEFHAPLLEAGNLRGFVRLGYFVPRLGYGADQLSFLATVSLPVILLVPLFYFLLRRETRPIAVANEQVSKLLEGESLRQIEITASGELAEFMQRFNSVIELARNRIGTLEQDQQKLITSSKLMNYRKNRVETVLEAVPEAIMILDETGSITFANQKLATMFGVSSQVIMSKEPHQWCENPDILALLAKYQTGSNARHFTETIRFNLQALNERAIATKTYTLFSSKQDGEVLGTLIIFRDETQEALARQARGDFVAHLSHELKSPLNVLALYSESLLGESGRKEEFRVEAANVISEEVERLSSLISSLLSLTQIESGSLTPSRSLVKLPDVATAAFDEARHAGKNKDLEFVFDVPKQMNPVLVDKALLRIAITNLLSNAVKYNQPGGEVRLTIEETDDAVQIRVADSGIGVSEEEAAKIFDKFYRSTDKRVQGIGGHGLGLALTKQIIELHHGTLSLNHDREEGSEFIINLWKETTTVKQAI